MELRARGVAQDSPGMALVRTPMRDLRPRNRAIDSRLPIQKGEGKLQTPVDKRSVRKNVVDRLCSGRNVTRSSSGTFSVFSPQSHVGSKNIPDRTSDKLKYSRESRHMRKCSPGCPSAMEIAALKAKHEREISELMEALRSVCDPLARTAEFTQDLTRTLNGIRHPSSRRQGARSAPTRSPIVPLYHEEYWQKYGDGIRVTDRRLARRRSFGAIESLRDDETRVEECSSLKNAIARRRRERRDILDAIQAHKREVELNSARKHSLKSISSELLDIPLRQERVRTAEEGLNARNGELREELSAKQHEWVDNMNIIERLDRMLFELNEENRRMDESQDTEEKTVDDEWAELARRDPRFFEFMNAENRINVMDCEFDREDSYLQELRSEVVRQSFVTELIHQSMMRIESETRAVLDHELVRIRLRK